MTAASNSDARKRHAAQDAPDTLTDKLHAFFYSKNTVNWPGSLAEEVAAIVAEHYGAEVAAERERADAAEARWAHVVRDHTMPPDKDSRGYDYRMGWWDAILLADRIMQRRVRICDDCPDDHLRAALGGEATP